MSDVRTVRDAIVAKLQGIDGIGRVHDRQRPITSAGDLKTHYFDQALGALRGWYVQRAATAETSHALGSYVITHTWRIQGFMALDDDAESRLVFDDLIEAIRDAFRADETIGGAAATTVIDDVAGVQVEDVGEVWFLGKALCHAAKLRLVTRHYR